MERAASQSWRCSNQKVGSKKLMETWTSREAYSWQRWSSACSATQGWEIYLERAVQHLYALELKCDRKDNPVSVEEQSYEPDTTSRSKRTTVVIADIAVKDQVTDENDTLQVNQHLISSGHQMGEGVKNFTEPFYQNLLDL